MIGDAVMDALRVPQAANDTAPDRSAA